jgi:hypothetical protein
MSHKGYEGMTDRLTDRQLKSDLELDVKAGNNTKLVTICKIFITNKQ